MQMISPDANAGVAGKIFQDFEQRARAGEKIPLHIVDSLTRIHPNDIARFSGEDFELFDGVDPQEHELASPDEAREQIAYRYGPTFVSFAETVDTGRYYRIHPLVLEDIGAGNAAIALAEQREWFKHTGFFPFTKYIGEELFEGIAETLDIQTALEAFLRYTEQTVPDLVVDNFQLFDSDSAKGARPSDEIEPKIIVCIPVANGQERHTLPHTLELLANQTLDHSSYEIVLLHNTWIEPEIEDKIFDEVGEFPGDFYIDQIMEVKWAKKLYEELQTAYPNLNIRAELALMRSTTTIGYCRGEIGKRIAKKYIERGSTNNPLVLSMDADVATLNKRYLEEMVNTADTSGSPALGSRVVYRLPGGIGRDTTVSKLLRFNHFIQHIGTSAAGLPPIMDTGTAIRLKEYALLNGHHWKDMFSENLNMIHILRMIAARNGTGDALTMSNGSILGTNPRRQIDAMARGHAPTEAWSPEHTSFGELDDPVRIQEVPLSDAELNANKMVEVWIRKIVERAVGSVDGELFNKKETLIRKGLQLLHLPDVS